MQSLIKRNNFSPEDRKILNKIDRHIKELEWKVEQGGGGNEEGDNSGGTEVYDINIELPEEYEDVFLKQKELNYDDVIREELSSPSIIEATIPAGSFVNVYINNKFYFSALVTEITYMGYATTILVPNLQGVDGLFGSSKSSLEPMLNIVGTSGMTLLTFINQYYDSKVVIEGNEVIQQDPELFKVMYNDIGERQVIRATIRRTTESSQSFNDIYFELQSGLDTNKLFIAEDVDGKIGIRFDSEGIIQQVITNAYFPWEVYDIIKNFEERIKALENGN